MVEKLAKLIEEEQKILTEQEEEMIKAQEGGKEKEKKASEMINNLLSQLREMWKDLPEKQRIWLDDYIATLVSNELLKFTGKQGAILLMDPDRMDPYAYTGRYQPFIITGNIPFWEKAIPKIYQKIKSKAAEISSEKDKKIVRKPFFRKGVPSTHEEVQKDFNASAVKEILGQIEKL